MRLRQLSVLMATAALLLSGCGGDSDPPDEPGAEASVEATDGADETEAPGDEASDPPDDGGADEAAFREEFAATLAEELGASRDDGMCVSAAMVDAIGYDQIQATGVTPEEIANTSSLAELDLTVDPAALGDELGTCEGILRVLASGQDVTTDELECAEAIVPNEAVGQVLAALFAGTEPPAEAGALVEEARSCFAD